MNRVTMFLERVGDDIPESHRVKENTTLPLPGRLGHWKLLPGVFERKMSSQHFVKILLLEHVGTP